MRKKIELEDDNKRTINDFIVLLKCAYNVYELKDNERIKKQILIIADGIKSCYNAGKLRKKVLDTINLYINNLLTEDEIIILPEGKVLIEILK